MQSETPDRAPSGADDDNLSQGNKRRRTSERSSRTTQDLESANAPQMGRRTLTTSSPQRGSSRDMTPPESTGSIKYTRTGRVSKATKGQRVHHCDECGKTYTRAEHLRRHQQNHKPGAFPCDVPGCTRSFYREDLLIRHKARHNDPNNPPSRPASPSSQDSASVDREQSFIPLSRPPTLGQSPVVQSETEPIDRERSSTQTRIPDGSSRQHNKHFTNFSRNACAFPVTVDTNPSYPEISFGNGWHWDPSSPYSPSGYDSPTNGAYYPSGGPPYFQPQPGRGRHSSDASYLGYYPYPQTSRSPVSAGSSTIHLPPQWGQNGHDPSFQHFGTSFGSEHSFQKGFELYNGHMANQSIHLATFDNQRLLTPEDRDLMEQNELLIPTPSPRGSSLDLSLDELSYSNDERYLGAYWRWIHPFFPIVHQPTFILPSASPLLRAAMLALGAHALPDTADKRNARIIHEKCVKVVKKRTLNSWHSFRTCDMQAIVLMEVYSIFKSRRPPLQLSKLFLDVYSTLSTDIIAVSGEITTESIHASGIGYLDDVTLAIDAKSKHRLFLACYVLDQQHAALFGRPRTTCFAGVGADLPLPRPQTTWDATHGHFSEQATQGTVWDALNSETLTDAGQPGYDVFQSLLMMASLGDGNDFDAQLYDSGMTSKSDPMLSKMEQSPRIKMAYHTFMLCQNTPIRDLLGVAGESWVMAEKLSSQSKYTEAQIETQHWAKGVQESSSTFAISSNAMSVSTAVRHALRILELHSNHPRIGLLFEEWAVYLASIVLWARAYVTAGKLEQGRRLSVQAPSERRPSLHELDQELPNILAATKNTDINIDQAKTVLLWAKTRIETVDIPHNCGLTNGALDVLGKLATRGSESGWFGS